MDAALDRAIVAEDNFRLLPAEHPAKVETSLLVFARPPPNLRFQVTFTLDGQAKNFELPDLQMHALAFRYVGATPADEQAIQQAGGIVNVIPYQVNVAPVLRLDGVEVQRFNPLNPGLPQTLNVQVTVPGGSPAFASHHLVAGSVYAISVSAGQVPAGRVNDVRRATQGLTGDDLVEAQSQLALALYAQQLEANETRLFALQGHATIEDILEGTAGQDLRVQFIAGTPVSLAPGTYFIDVRRDSLTPIAKDRDASMVPELVKLSGHDGSALEFKVWQEILSAEGVSAVKIIQAAASQLVPVFKLTRGSPQRQQLQNYSTPTLADVDNALAAGWLVTIPQRPINYLTYSNQEGYIVINPVDGSGGYLINNLLNGGGSNGQNPNPGPSENCSCCDGACMPIGSTVNLANGTWRETFPDLMLAAIGLPIVFNRVYQSRSPAVTEMGAGWMHSYGIYLRPETDGFTYIDEEMREAKFTRITGGYQRPPGFAITLIDLADGHRLRTKRGTVYEFNTSNQLRSIAEPNGNTTRVVYSGSLISQVLDSSGAVALSFAHTGNKITGVTDRANRTLAFTYNGDDLTSATDVLGKTERYAYDSAHHLTQRTDRRGKVWTNFYDLRGRWVGSRNPLGQENSVTYDLVNLRSIYTDRTGHAWTTVYNAAGNPLVNIDPLGNREENTWDSDFNRLTHKDSRGLVTTMQYDANRNLLSRSDPDNRVTSYTYEPNFNQTLTINSTGLPFISNTYDSANGRLLSRTDGLGTTSYGYDGRGQLQNVTAPGNSITGFSYDANGSVKTVTSPANGVTTLDYDGAGHLIKVTDPNLNVRTLEVDAKGQVKAMVDARLARTEFTYDDNGNRLTVKDAALNTTSFAYDDANRLVRTTDALNNTTRTEYDGEGRATARIDAKGARTITKYDDAGRVSQTIASDGATATFAFCAAIGASCSGGSCSGAAEPCCAIDALGNMTTKEFDSVGRVTKVTDPLGRQTIQTYESGGRLDSVSGPNQAPTQYRYGSNGLPSSVATTFSSINYQYDGRGNRTQVNANGQVTNFAYDLANRLTSETNPLNIATRYTYDAANNRKTKTDGNNQATTYGYDANNRLTSVTFQDATQYLYDYDSRGNRTLEQNPTHRRTLIFDELNRVKQVNDATFGKTISYGYDANGNRTSLTEGTLTFGYGYDSLNRLRRATDAFGNSTTFEHDLAGRRSATNRPNGVRTTYAYDASNQVTNIFHAKASAVLLAFSYGYDNQGNRISKTREDGTREVYASDGDFRLTGVAYGTSRSVQYSLDALGNRTFMADSSPPSPTESTRTAFSYNGFSQLNTKTQFDAPFAVTNFGYDNNGNLLSETIGTQVKNYTWDLDDRLRQVRLPGGTTNLFDYDANGLRIRKNDSTGTTSFLLDGPNILEELNVSATIVTSYFTNPQAIDEIESFQQAAATYYPLLDALGTIYAIADSTGAVVRSNSYDVYGERLGSTGTGPHIAFGYTGREHSPDNPLNYNRDRYLDVRGGRWNQPDHRGMDAGVNFYLYVNSRPTLYVDPEGTHTEVIYFRPVSWGASSFGHLFVRIDEAAYTFGPPASSVQQLDFRAYMNRNTFRDAVGAVLDLAPHQEQALARGLLGFNAPYRSTGPNCTAPFLSAARSIGIYLEATILPETLLKELLATGHVIGESYYAASSSPAMTPAEARLYNWFGEAPWSRHIWRSLTDIGF